MKWFNFKWPPPHLQVDMSESPPFSDQALKLTNIFIFFCECSLEVIYLRNYFAEKMKEIVRINQVLK